MSCPTKCRRCSAHPVRAAASLEETASRAAMGHQVGQMDQRPLSGPLLVESDLDQSPDAPKLPPRLIVLEDGAASRGPSASVASSGGKYET